MVLSKIGSRETMYTSGLDQVVLCPNRKPLLGPGPPAMVLAEDDLAIEQEVVLFYDFSRVGHFIRYNI